MANVTTPVITHYQESPIIPTPPTVIDPNCSIHGLSADQRDTLQEATTLISTQQVSTQKEPDSHNAYALQDATSTSKIELNTSSLPDATASYTLLEATELGIKESCALITVQMDAENATGASNHNMDAALDYSTSLDATQEYSIGELMVIAPITTPIENIDHGTVAPHSETIRLTPYDPANVYTQSLTTPTETDSAESETPKYMKIYYSCLMPQEDDIIYIHYCDIVARPCVVNLPRLTQQDIEMYTSIKDTDINLSQPKHKRTHFDYSGFESNDQTEPKPKKQTVTRPGREPSAQRIATQKLVMSS